MPRRVYEVRAVSRSIECFQIGVGLGKIMQKAEREEATEVFKDRATQILVSKFLGGEIKTLEPTYDSQVGYRYTEVEAIVGDASLVETFLKRLHDSGVLDRKLFDKIIVCPKCDSPNISIRYCCPFCKSFEIEKSSLVEHVKCGYMDLEANFRKDDKYLCPKCHEEMRTIDVDYRKAGVWCTCKSCGKSFDIPVSAHFCRSCHATSTFEDASLEDVYSYTLKDTMRKESSLSFFLVPAIRELLVGQGLKVESPAFVVGKSGAKHSFDIVAQRGSGSRKAIVIDVATSSEAVVSEQPVIALFAKVFDVTPEKAFLVAIPRLSENGKKMAELYSIRVVEAETQDEAVKALKATLKK
jgi:transcription elongation factor Elf1